MKKLSLCFCAIFWLCFLLVPQGFSALAGGEGRLQNMPVEMQEEIVSRIQNPLQRARMYRDLGMRVPERRFLTGRYNVYFHLNDLLSLLFGQGIIDVGNLHELDMRQREILKAYVVDKLNMRRSASDKDGFKSITIDLDFVSLFKRLRFPRTQQPRNALEIAINSLLKHLCRILQEVPEEDEGYLLAAHELSIRSQRPWNVANPLKTFGVLEISLPPFLTNLPNLSQIEILGDLHAGFSPGSIDRVIENKLPGSVGITTPLSTSYIPKLGRLLAKKGYRCEFRDEILKCPSSDTEHLGISYQKQDIHHPGRHSYPSHHSFSGHPSYAEEFIESRYPRRDLVERGEYPGHHPRYRNSIGRYSYPGHHSH